MALLVDEPHIKTQNIPESIPHPPPNVRTHPTALHGDTNTSDEISISTMTSSSDYVMYAIYTNFTQMLLLQFILQITMFYLNFILVSTCLRIPTVAGSNFGSNRGEY